MKSRGDDIHCIFLKVLKATRCLMFNTNNFYIYIFIFIF